MDSHSQLNHFVRHGHWQRVLSVYGESAQRDCGDLFCHAPCRVADWLFTTPSVIIQLISGIGLAHMLGLPLTEGWVFWGLVLYCFAGACWLPVVWMQIKMRDMAKHALDTSTELPARYWVFDRWWIMLGSLAFPAIMIVFYLMVVKPI